MHIYWLIVCTSYIIAFQEPRAESMVPLRAQWERLGWLTPSGLNNTICSLAAQKLLLEKHSVSEVREIHNFLDPLLNFKDIERSPFPLKDKLAFRLLLTTKENNNFLAQQKMRMLHKWADLLQKKMNKSMLNRVVIQKKLLSLLVIVLLLTFAFKQVLLKPGYFLAQVAALALAHVVSIVLVVLGLQLSLFM